MAIIRWEPARGLRPVPSDINRLFSTFFDTPTHAATLQRRWVPATDLTQTETEYVLHADLPGLSEADVRIEVENDVLTISGERASSHEDEQGGFRRIERVSGSFRRSLRLPEGVDAEAITAGFDKGVLEVHVPKPVAAKPRKVEISVGAPVASLETAEGTPAPEAPEAA